MAPEGEHHEPRTWEDAGFDEFEGQLAAADGFSPSMAVHYRAALKKVAASWRQAGMADEEGLGWHIAGFPARLAAEYHRQGRSLEDVRPAAGYGPAGLGSGGAS